MKITGEVKADLIGLGIKHNDESGTRTATPKIRLSCDEPRCKALFGQEFADLVFGPASFTVNEQNEPTSRWKKLVPREKFEVHTMRLGKQTLGVQPKITNIEPVKKERAVLIDIQLPLVLESREVAADLALSVGEVVALDFNPAQPDLFEGKPSKGPKIVKRKGQGPFGNPEEVPQVVQ